MAPSIQTSVRQKVLKSLENKINMKRLLVFVQLVASAFGLAAQTTESEIESLINQMTLEEKVRMCYGGEEFGVVKFPGVERLGIPTFYGSDGPRGVTIGDVTAMPSGICLASTWNPVMAERAGRVIGEEGRRQGVSIIFGPAFNINRDPLGARFFEYMSEDPVVSGKMAAGQVRGIQSEGVAACMKHFACNGRDWNRNLYMTWADERTLREIYLRGFEICQRESGPWSVMTAANGLNGELCSDNHWLLQQVLKNEWGFRGIVLTDFCHSRSTVKAALAGLDMDMPWGTFEDIPFGKKLADAVTEGKVPMEVLNEMVRRHLWLRYQIGLMGQKQSQIGKGELNTPEHQQVAYDAASEGIVLLKNDRLLLPLNENKVKNIVVLGPNADRRFDVLGLGGSSGAQSPWEVTVVQGLKENLDGKATVTSLPLTGEADFRMLNEKEWIQPLKIDYCNPSGTVTQQATASQADFSWFNHSPVDNIAVGELQATINGRFRAPETGIYIVRLTSDDVADLWVNDMGAQTVRNIDHGVPQSGTALLSLQAGQECDVRIVYRQTAEGAKNATEMNYWAKGLPSVRLEWSLPGSEEGVRQQLKRYRKQIQKADVVLFVGGLDHNLDCEGRDRATMDFPLGQAELVRQIAMLNKNVVVALYNGAPLTLPFIDKVPAVIDLFYPGMQGGRAFADILTGNVCPSGKLTFSWPKRYENAPLNVFSSQDLDNVYCREKLMVGYRYYDTHGVEPLFPFGHGLSYTQFKYDDLSVSSDGHEVSFMLTNTGKCIGKETVQLYIGQPDAKVERPVHELKAFEKVELKPGESKKVSIKLSEDDYSYWSVAKQKWQKDGGRYTIEVGASSRDIRLRKEIVL